MKPTVKILIGNSRAGIISHARGCKFVRRSPSAWHRCGTDSVPQGDIAGTRRYGDTPQTHIGRDSLTLDATRRYRRVQIRFPLALPIRACAQYEQMIVPDVARRLPS